MEEENSNFVPWIRMGERIRMKKYIIQKVLIAVVTLLLIILILFLPLGSFAVSIAMKFIPDLICLPSERHRYFK